MKQRSGKTKVSSPLVESIRLHGPVPSNSQAQELAAALNNVESLRKELLTEKQNKATLENRLSKLQRLYDTMAHNFPDGMICILNREMRNALLEGGSTDQIGVLSTDATNTESNSLFFNKTTLAKLTKAFDGEVVQCETYLEDRFYRITAVPLSDGKKIISEILCVAQDFTERKSMEEGLIKALEKEKELGELKSRFVTMASHEFRTPLTTILSSTFLIENLAGQNSERDKIIHTNRIKRAVNNLTLILNEFLSLEKLEQNKVEVVTSDVNIPEYIQDTISEMEVLRRDGQVIEYHHLGDQWITRIDHHLLWSIVTNLISNSLKYSKTGDKIEITSSIANNTILFTVKDPGIGIPADEHQHIFERFYRARNASNFEGTGLGLHIIQKYIHLLKGTITFTSELDCGTTFYVTLPVTRELATNVESS